MEQILKLNKALEDFEARNDLSSKLGALKSENNIKTQKELEDLFESLSNQDRELKIGILGRVKAGKSSFLNALIFKGGNVLPKAATPMTAALTILEYGESFEAFIDFYSDDDIKTIKERYENATKILDEKYKSHLKNLTDNNRLGKSTAELEKMARDAAKDELKGQGDLSAYYEQGEMLKTAPKPNTKDAKISANSYEELNSALSDYVGSSGKYMPYTKSITLKLNEELLKDVNIVDTPGVNDPVASREERTKEYIAHCDVVFLLSPAGQFLSGSDEDLLDRIENKNGIKEYFVVATQLDNQLMAEEIIGDDANLHEAIKRACKALSRSQNNFFSKASNEIAKKFIDNEVLFSSGVCIEIANNYDDIKDSNAKKVLNNLKTEYPDFFGNKESAIINLKTLGNMDKINKILENVRAQKDEIIRQKLENATQSIAQNLQNYHAAIKKEISKDLTELENADIEKIKANIEALQSEESQIVEKANESFEDAGLEKCSALQNNLIGKVNEYFDNIDEKSNDAVGSKSEERTKRVKNTDKSWWQFWRDDYKYETYSVNIKTINAGKITGAIKETLREINNLLSESCDYYEIKKSIKKKVLADLMSHGSLDPSKITSSINEVFESITLPAPSFDTALPSHLDKSGTISGDSECDEFVDAVSSYANDIKLDIKDSIRQNISILKSAIKKANLGSKIIQEYKAKMDEFQKELANKEESIEKYKDLLAQLENIN